MYIPYSTGSCLTCSSFSAEIFPWRDGHALLCAWGAGSQSMGREVSLGCFHTLNWLAGGRSTDSGVTSCVK